ncbi:hypothetical protein MKW98_028983, partial [Papaver atlanticum]
EGGGELYERCLASPIDTLFGSFENMMQMVKGQGSALHGSEWLVMELDGSHVMIFKSYNGYDLPGYLDDSASMYSEVIVNGEKSSFPYGPY